MANNFLQELWKVENTESARTLLEPPESGPREHRRNWETGLSQKIPIEGGAFACNPAGTPYGGLGGWSFIPTGVFGHVYGSPAGVVHCTR